ncbi:methyltransferase domain-containing protein [Candidatus Frankia alpina]|uniref:methyltransferase domain-containing protein n=1 Tax=Candidatus Frankia alpina TaxID=2699483 RepID=UPI001F1CC5F7|nr:methyltransferase domain-containing protein [Candidatus Frankia alpina]
MAPAGTGLAAVLPVLRCPVCTGAPPAGQGGAPHADGALHEDGGALRCAAGHGFDIGRGGYVNLRTGRARRVTGDTAAMVAARQSFLGAGHYRPLTTRLAELAAASPPGARSAPNPAWDAGPGTTCHPASPAGSGPVVLEIGAGTGHHLAGVLAALPTGAVGVAVDVSKYALRRAARAHPKIGAVAFDAAGPWPVADASVGVLLDVFAPRNPAEMRRVLRPDGLLIVVTPEPGHLAELRGPLGLVGMQPDKGDRLDERTADRFAPAGLERFDIPLVLSPDEAVDLALMGPTGHHRTAEDLRHRAETAWPRRQAAVTVRLVVRCYRPRG